MEVYGRKKGQKRPFIFRIHSELVSTELFRQVSDHGGNRCYRLVGTPFRLLVKGNAKSYSDLSWQIDTNSKLGKKLAKSSGKIMSKPIRVKRYDPKALVEARRPNFIDIHAMEFRQMFMDIFDDIPDYMQEGFVCNMHIFSPDLIDDEE